MTIESKTTPEVQFTIHRMGFGRRTDLDFATLAFRQRLRELESDHPPRTDQEKELAEQLGIATRKALGVPADEYLAVYKKDVVPIEEELKACVPPEIQKRRAVLNEEYVAIESRIQAAWIRAGLVAISGGGLDGMTADQLLDYGPQELALEIYGALASDGRLGGSKIPNSGPLTISGEVVGGTSPSTTAIPADSQETPGTSSEIASSTSSGT